MLRIAIPGLDVASVGLCEEALQPRAGGGTHPQAVAVAALAWLKMSQAIPDFVADLDTATELLADIPTDAPKAGAAVRWQIAFAALGLPGAADRLRLCDEALAVDPDAEDPWWDQIRTGMDITITSASTCAGATCCWRSVGTTLRPTAPRSWSSANTGNSGIVAVAHARAALLDLDGRFVDVPASAARIREVVPGFSPWYFMMMARVAFEEGRFDEVLPAMEAHLTTHTNLGPIHKAMVSRARLESGDAARRETEVLDHLVGAWTELAHDYLWTLTLADARSSPVSGPPNTPCCSSTSSSPTPVNWSSAVRACSAPGRRTATGACCWTCSVAATNPVAALTAALALEESVESPTFTARTRYWLAHALLRRDGPGDRERAGREIDRSMEPAAQLGMSALLAAGRDLAHAA